MTRVDNKNKHCTGARVRVLVRVCSRGDIVDGSWKGIVVSGRGPDKRAMRRQTNNPP